MAAVVAASGAGLILTWGGLRGAISLALALSIPHIPQRPLLLALTFFTVSLSVVVQGLTFLPLAKTIGDGETRSPDKE